MVDAWRKRFRTPLERVVRAEVLIMACSPDLTDRKQGCYALECGHLEIGRLGSRRLHCSSCQKIWDLGLDWDGYRHHGMADPLIGLEEGA